MAEERCGMCNYWHTTDTIQRIYGEGNGRCSVRDEITFCDKHNCIAFYNAEQTFHNNRTTFAVMHDIVHYGPKGLSHKDWLVGQNIITEDEYNQVVRGYFDETGIYFYQGNFETNETVESTALKVANQFDDRLPIYCGCIIGEVGERWKPIKQLR